MRGPPKSTGKAWPPKALSATTVHNVKPKAAPYKLADEKGLLLLVQPSGGMLWRMKYRVDGRDDASIAKRIKKKLSPSP